MRSLLVATLLLLTALNSQVPAQSTDKARLGQENASATKRRDNIAPVQREPVPSPALITEPEAGDLKPERDFEQTDGDKQRHQRSDDYWEKAATITNAVATLAIAAFTFFLVRFGAQQARGTTQQARATKHSVDVMRDSIRVASEALDHARETAKLTLEESRRATMLSLRAWLVIQSMDLIELDGYPRPYDEGWFRIVVRNAGKTPAISVAATFQPTIIPNSDPAPGVFGNLGADGVVIAADEIRSIAFGITNLTQERIAALRSGDLFLWITARLAYTDALGAAGETLQSGHYRKPSGTQPESFISNRDGTSMT